MVEYADGGHSTDWTDSEDDGAHPDPTEPLFAEDCDDLLGSWHVKHRLGVTIDSGPTVGSGFAGKLRCGERVWVTGVRVSRTGTVRGLCRDRGWITLSPHLVERVESSRWLPLCKMPQCQLPRVHTVSQCRRIRFGKRRCAAALAVGLLMTTLSVLPRKLSSWLYGVRSVDAQLTSLSSLSASIFDGHVPSTSLFDGHVPSSQWGADPDNVAPLPSFSERRPRFPEPDFGNCEQFGVPNGRVYGVLVPSKDDHVGQAAPGRVFVRCNPHWELRRHFNPERRCILRSGLNTPQQYVWEPDDSTFFISISSEEICKRSTPAVLTQTATFEVNEHLRCFEQLVQKHPEPGKAPPVSTAGTNENLGNSLDFRSEALQCLGCAPPSLEDSRLYDCHSERRLFEIADIHCSRQEQLGALSPNTYCM